VESRASRSVALSPAGFVLLGLAFCAALGLAACGGSASAPHPRNAILISIDTLRPDHLGCYGHEAPTSPTLDALAARGVRFADVTAAAPWTLPSHASMLTGLYAGHHGVKDHESRLPESTVTLAEEFQAKGFATAAVVNTWNVGAPQFHLSQGFTRFCYVPETEVEASTGLTRMVDNGREVVAKAKEFLAESGAQPFFLFLHFYDVHTDFTPRAPYRAQFVAPYAGKLTGRSLQLQAYRARGETLGADDLRYLEQLYDAEIRQLDDLLGRFFTWLDGEKKLADTLIVVTSDHGEEFQEHGGILHGRTQYQELLRVPLILAGPGVPPATVIEAPVHGVDIAPTILARMGLGSSMPRDGLDLAPAWRGEALPERALFAEADHTNEVDGDPAHDIKHMIRRGSEKLHLDRHTHALELYDLSRDPGEHDDLASREAARAQALLAELERFQASAVAPQAIPAPTKEEQHLLDQLGYGGGDGEGDE
jgi:arylsulfatase A-like enzyme